MNVILYSIAECLEVVKIYLLLHYMTDAQEKKKRRQLFIVIAVLTAKVISYTIFGESLFSYCVMVIAIVHTLFENKWYKNIIWSIWAAEVVGVIDLFGKELFRFIIDENGMYADSIQKLYSAPFCIVVVLILGEVYIRLNHGRFTLPLIYYAGFSGIALVNGLLLDTYVSGVQKQYVNSNAIPVGVVICVGACVIGFLTEMLLILMFGSLNYIHSEREQLQNEMIRAQKEHYEELELREADTRRFRHDIADHIHVIQQLLNEKKYEDALTYIHSTNEMIDSLKRVSVGNNAVDAVLSQYMAIAQENGILLKIKGKLPQNVYVPNYDLCTIVSNILRNAITASKETRKTPTIYIQFRYDDEYLYIQEKNSCDPQVCIENTIPDTTKTDWKNHGYGMKNIKRAVEKNKGILTVIAKQGDFVLNIILKNEEVRQ